MPPSSPIATAVKAGSSSKASLTKHKVPLVTHDYRADPYPYPALKTEQGVFTTPPYSAEIKGLWRFKDEASSRESAEGIWVMFKDYGGKNDFIGMDTARKFIQMGRTRSLRYALRPGGQKYTTDENGDKHQMERTGEVHDEEKLKGANVYEDCLARCWEDTVYKQAWDRWRRGDRWEVGVDDDGDGDNSDSDKVQSAKPDEDGDTGEQKNKADERKTSSCSPAESTSDLGQGELDRRVGDTANVGGVCKATQGTGASSWE